MKQEQRVSKAAVRRLAQDGGGRLTKLKHDDVVRELDVFLAALLKASESAMVFARRRTLTEEHVRYAVQALGMSLPPELAAQSGERLQKLQRCNVRAPALVRKASATSAEISEAAFARLARQGALACPTEPRLSLRARHLMQLVVEEHLVDLFRAAPRAEEIREAAAVNAFAACAGVAAPIAAEMMRVATAICNQAPALLGVTSRQTVDDRLVLAAASAVAPGLVLGGNEEAPAALIKVCDRVLRGHVVDRRVTCSAAAALAKVLLTAAATLQQEEGAQA